jgi:methionyl-tRNA formyltransferase
MTPLRIGYAGDRDIAVWCLRFLLDQHVRPEVLLVTEPSKASHADELRRMCDDLPDDRILVGAEFRGPSGVELLRSLKLDYIIGIHFPYIVPPEVLALTKGFMNLHPAYLPYNRGWHTPSWAILEGSPIGATFHFMDAGIDSGDILHQRRLTVAPSDTANSLYARVKKLEFEVFTEAWPLLASGDFRVRAQVAGEGTTHMRKELFTDPVQHIELDAPTTARALLRKLRALTTNRWDEAAYFVEEDKVYRVQVAISEEEQ